LLERACSLGVLRSSCSLKFEGLLVSALLEVVFPLCSTTVAGVYEPLNPMPLSYVSLEGSKRGM
jgi:hypothetical protein